MREETAQVVGEGVGVRIAGGGLGRGGFRADRRKISWYAEVLASSQIAQGHAERVEVARRRRRTAIQPLWRQIVPCAASVGQLVGGKTGEAKVAKLDRAVLSDEDI